MRAHRQAVQFLAAVDDADDVRQVGVQPKHFCRKVENDPGLFATHGARYDLAVLLRFRSNQVRENEAGNQGRFAILSGQRQIGLFRADRVVVNVGDECALEFFKANRRANQRTLTAQRPAAQGPAAVQQFKLSDAATEIQILCPAR